MVALSKPSTTEAIYKALEDAPREGGRAHLGASIIGEECSRKLWYTFRWALQPQFPGRTLRIFRRGNIEEEHLTSDLRAAGITIFDEKPGGGQFRFETFCGHFGGSMDGAGKGFPECSNPEKWHVVEYKTMNRKNFNRVEKVGVKEAQLKHYAQMQVYMYLSGDSKTRMERAMYIAVCKDDDRIYSERVKFDCAFAKSMLKKAEEIIFADEPPARINSDPEFFQCRFCDFAELCHGRKIADVSCRTCTHAVVERSGTWSCHQSGNNRTQREQEAACAEHVFNPHLLENIGERGEASERDNWIEYKLPNGKTCKNGSRSRDVYTSKELNAIPPDMLGDERFEQLRAEFDATVVPVTSDGVTLDDMRKSAEGVIFDDDIPF